MFQDGCAVPALFRANVFGNCSELGMAVGNPTALHQGLAYEARAQHNMVPPALDATSGVDASDTHWFGLVGRPRPSSVMAKLSMHHPKVGAGTVDQGKVVANQGNNSMWSRRDRHGASVIRTAASGMGTNSAQHSLANCCWATSEHPHRRQGMHGW